MLNCQATTTPRLYDVDGLTQFGCRLDRPDLDYLLINRAGPDDAAHHYVEFWDQSCGRFDGIETVSLSDDRRVLTVSLKFDVNGLGRDFRITSREPVDAESDRWLRTLSEEIR